MSEALADAPTGAASPEVQPGPAPSAWDDPLRTRAPATSPVLAVDGFEGPLDWLLEMARTRKIDLARLSILALVEAFAGAMAAALAQQSDNGPALDLLRWGGWTVMAAQLTELRSRLLLPADAPQARTAQAEAEALRQQWIRRAETAAAADWLERRPQLGFEVFARGRPEAGRAAQGSACASTWNGGVGRAGPAGELASSVAKDETGDGLTEDGNVTEAPEGDPEPVSGGDLTDLLRACLVALRLPRHTGTYQPRRLPFWGISDAAARITRLLAGLPDGGDLGVFLPAIADASASRALHCRAAVAATFVAGLELTRGGALTLDQDTSWQPIQVRRRDDNPKDSAAKPTNGGREPSLA